MPKASLKSRRAADGQTKAALGDLAGCPFHDLRVRLAAAGLRATRQRMSLGWILFSRGARHLTAERLQEEAQESNVSISLATIYNSLHQFTNAGLLCAIAVDGTRTYFDTNTVRHHHFLDDGVLIDIPELKVDVTSLPAPPAGKRIAEISVVVRLRDDSPAN
ncbi:iron response transcriptional regulator IrrA [Methylocella sp.]|jgi:Fur family iron response transcriptional regulator|uniref:iron response transcriptional regulator IrrA n=1 Tax=Methylocella sp. TaxID=1978226 RepID=UPI003C172769